MPSPGTSNLTLAAVLANSAIAVAKLIASAMTGSAAILAEAIHSLAAVTSQALLLLGLTHAARPSRPSHPLRQERELRFWASVVPILLYSLGAGVAINEGIDQFQHPRVIADASSGHAVLAIALLIQAALGYQAWRQTCAPPDTGYAAACAVSLETKAAFAGLVAALAGLALADGLGWTEADALASVAVGIIMGCVAALMALETRALLVREPPAGASPHATEAAKFSSSEVSPARTGASQKAGKGKRKHR